jgi:hypothetical protein
MISGSPISASPEGKLQQKTIRNVIEGWNLIPSRDNIDEFKFADPDAITTIEDRFPRAWKYLCKHEDELRGRENDRYAKAKPDGVVWYGAPRPQNLDYYFRPKLMVQLLTCYNSVAYDPNGKFVFQAGAKVAAFTALCQRVA